MVNFFGETNTRKYREAGLAAHRSGEIFENIIDRACARYKSLNLACIEKTPEPLHIAGKGRKPGHFDCYFLKQAQPDYQGTLAGGRSIVFEAKNTMDTNIRQDRLTWEQINDLDQHERLGAICFVLISFSCLRFYAVPFKVWQEIPEVYGKASVNEKDLKEYAVPDIIDFLNCKAVNDALAHNGQKE